MRFRHDSVPNKAEALDLRRHGKALEKKIERLEEGTPEHEKALTRLDDIAERLHRHEQFEEYKNQQDEQQSREDAGQSFPSVQKQVLRQLAGL